jgi:hypothetical protein
MHSIFSRSSELAPAGEAHHLKGEYKNESARGFRPWRSPDVLAANWITIALQHRMGLRVSPLPASCRAAAGARFSSCLVSQALRLSSPQVFRSPQSPLRQLPLDASSGYPDSYIFRLAYGESPGRPGPSLRLRRLPANFQVSLAVVPSSSTGRSRLRSPQIPSSGVAANASPGFPGSCVRGWVDDEPGQPELCIFQRGWKMNLRVQSGVAYSTGLRCRPDLASSLHPPDKPACEAAQRNRICIVLPESNCLPNSLQVHQLETELRSFRTVNASAKAELICGFHRHWCMRRNVSSPDQNRSSRQKKSTDASHAFMGIFISFEAHSMIFLKSKMLNKTNKTQSLRKYPFGSTSAILTCIPPIVPGPKRQFSYEV